LFEVILTLRSTTKTPFGSIEFLRNLFLKTQFLKNSLVGPLQLKSIFFNYLLSFINCILFTARATTTYFLYEQIKWGIDMSFEILKAEYQFLETDLETPLPNFF
jgi:hypothetical protein